MISKPQNSHKCGENELFAKSNTSENEVIAEDCAVDEKLDEFTDRAQTLGDRLLSAQEEVELACKIKQGDAEAREKLILSNVRLVDFVAKQYVGRGVDYEDLVQSGNIGLITAAEKFDPDKGFKFSTCATWWIRKEILRTVHENGQTIHLPEHVKIHVDKVLKAKTEFEKRNGEEPSVEVLAKILGETAENVNKYLLLAKPIVSIYDLIGDFDGEVLELIKDESESPEDVLEKKDIYDILREAVSKLDTREQEVIRLRFGLDGGEVKTQVAIAQALSVSRQYVRKVEDKALKKLRYPTFIGKLFSYYDQQN